MHKSVNTVLGKAAQFLVRYLEIGRCLQSAETVRVTASGNYSSERLANLQQNKYPSLDLSYRAIDYSDTLTYDDKLPGSTQAGNNFTDEQLTAFPEIPRTASLS
jgi:hypothetical protein